MRSPANASPRHHWSSTHSSGPERIATPYSVVDFHHLLYAGFCRRFPNVPFYNPFAEGGIMAKAVHTIPITQIILDEEIYPRSGVYPKRVSMFAENIRDGFETTEIPVHVITLDGVDPLLYAAKKAIGPLNLAACGGTFLTGPPWRDVRNFV